MPPYTRGRARDQLTFIQMPGGLLYYGFNTQDFASTAGLGLTVADLATLGHLDASQVPANGIRIFAANSPKPPRVKLVINRRPTASQQGDTSTYCAPANLRQAEAEGWKFAKSGRAVTITNSNRTWTMGVNLEGGGIYLFPMNPIDADAYADVLGLQRPPQISAAERQKAFSGSSRPRPAKVKLEIAGQSTINAFCSSERIDNALSNQWQLVKPAVEYN
ncbi:MAG: hypothetical protein QNJ42_19110 [Crocosphaera sp.]|nr:hypothetical protein [Crocosphaera sp.]